MDILYFRTNNRISLFTELGVPFEEKDGEIIHDLMYQSEKDWYMIWLGEDKEDGYFLFNIHLNGQKNMDYFTQKLVNAEQLIEPKTPKYEML